VILGVVGDSAAGKTTITRGLMRLLGEDMVTHLATDDYHRYDRRQRAENGITPLHPDCNYIDILEQHMRHLRAKEAVLKPVYIHADGTFGPPVYIVPRAFLVVEGLLGYHTPSLLEHYDVRVFLSPPELLRRRWKVDRDCSRRGYTTSEVLDELDRREADAEAFIRPQRRRADVVVSFLPPEDGQEVGQLAAELCLRDTLPHPDLSPLVGEGGITLEDHGSEQLVHIPARIDSDRAEAIEESIWSRMHFATHLRTERLGEYTIGTDLHRSDTLAIVQLLILYHLVTAKAAVALGGNGARRPAAQEPRPIAVP
jgi:phosphoribulokinase